MRAVIFANGIMDVWPLEFNLSVEDDLIIAADGGYNHCKRWDLKPHVLVGDMDSVADSDLSALEKTSTQILRYPAQKDETDLQLAIQTAVDRHATDIIILGALGSRWDMTLSNVLILTIPLLQNVDARILDGPDEIICLQGPGKSQLNGDIGHLLSLIPLSGPAIGVTLAGTAYMLDKATLPMGTSRGISNVFRKKRVTIEIESGQLLVVISREGSAT
jgi:thiamine pyrophosphokinase